MIREIAKKFIDYLAAVPGVKDSDISYDTGKKQLRVVVDEEKAKEYDLSVDDVASHVRYAFRGALATTIKPEKAEKEIDVLVRFPEKERNNPDAFENILISNKQ